MPFLILGILLVIFLIINFVVYLMIYYTKYRKVNNIYNIPTTPQYSFQKEKMVELIDNFKKIPYEQVYIKTFDGKKLSGRFYRFVDNDNNVDICFHGYKGSATRDFCGGGMIPKQTGHNMLIIEQRGHGKSGGCTLSFGINEKKDCMAWIYYVMDRFGKKTNIFLYGVSMGASTVLFASGLNLPSNVKGIIADSPYSSAPKIIKKVVEKDMKIPWWLVSFVVYSSAFIFGHFRLGEGDVIQYVKKAKLPILIIHGDDDRFVPCEMSKDIYEANTKYIKREVFEGAGHGISYIKDPDRYINLVVEFLNNIEK